MGPWLFAAFSVLILSLALVLLWVLDGVGKRPPRSQSVESLDDD